MISVSLGLTLGTWSLQAGAMVVKFPTESTADMRAIETVLDFLISPYANSQEGPEFLSKLQVTENLGPIFLNEFLELMIEAPYWEDPIDRKDDLLAMIPRWAKNPGFKAFESNPVRDEIRDKVRLLRRILVRGSHVVVRRATLFIQISRALGIWDASDVAFYKQLTQQGWAGRIDANALALMEQEILRPASQKVIDYSSEPTSKVISLNEARQKCQAKLLKPK